MLSLYQASRSDINVFTSVLSLYAFGFDKHCLYLRFDTEWQENLIQNYVLYMKMLGEKAREAKLKCVIV